MRAFLGEGPDDGPYLVDQILRGADGVLRLFRLVDPGAERPMDLAQLTIVEHHRVDPAKRRRLPRPLRHESIAVQRRLGLGVLDAPLRHPLKLLE